MPETQSQIAQDMIATLASATNNVTNLSPGGTVRALIDTVAAQCANLDQQILNATQAAIVNAAYQIWQATAPQAVGSTYTLTFSLSASASSSVTEAAGTLVAIPNSNLQWATGQSITVDPGQYVNVTATCTTTGSATNVPANSITQLVTPVPYLTVTNQSGVPTVLGTDPPTPTQIQAVLQQAVAQVQRAAQLPVEAGALTSKLTDASGNVTEAVAKALGVDLPAGGGDLYVYNGVGAMSSTLLAQTQNIVNGYTNAAGTPVAGYKSLGVPVTVLDALQNEVNVAGSLLPAPGYTLATITASANAAVEAFFQNLDIAQTLTYSALIFAILSAPGVANVSLTDPTTDLTGTPLVTPLATAPTGTAAAGSTSLAAGTYDLTVTFTTPWGETTAPAASSVTITAGEQIDVPSVTMPFGATGVNYYLSIAAGSTTLGLSAQNTTGAAQTLTAYGNSQQPPASNAATINGNLYVLPANWASGSPWTLMT